MNRDPLRLCERHVEEMVDPSERACIMAESLNCEGEEVEYESVDQMRSHYHRLSEERDAYMARAVGAEADMKRREQEIKALRETLHDLLHGPLDVPHRIFAREQAQILLESLEDS